MHDIPVKGLHSIERQDEVVRVTFSGSLALGLIETIFSDRFSLTLAPDGTVTMEFSVYNAI